MSLRFRLSVLVGVAMLPPLALTAYNTVHWQDVLEEQVHDDTLASARLLSAELAQVMEGGRQLMTALGNHPAVPEREEECVAYFRSVISEIPLYREAAVIDREGKFHCSTIEIPPTLDVRDRAYFRGPLQTGRLTIGTLVQGRVTRSSSVHLSMPLRKRNGDFDGVIVIILNPERLAEDLGQRPWPSGQVAMVMDREGQLVFSLPPDRQPLAEAMAAEVFRKASGSARAATMSATGVEHREQIVGFVPLSAPPEGLFVAVAADREEVLQPVRQVAVRSAIFGLLAMLLAVIGAFAVVHLLVRKPVLEMVEAARSRETAEPKPFPDLDRSTELGTLSHVLSQTSTHIEQLLEQKTFLLRELLHRVMNSLTLLTSVLRLQNRTVQDPRIKDQLSRAEARVYSIATVYRYLYQADSTERVDFGEVLRTICQETQRAYSGAPRATIEVIADPVMISMSNAGSLAMLVHELITNALKHAYPGGGPITVTLRQMPDRTIELRVTDRGQGLPADFSLERFESLGLKIITGTAQQLGGKTTVNRLDPGTEFVVRLPADVAKSG
jgi:two-component sensor histidine kinase